MLTATDIVKNKAKKALKATIAHIDDERVAVVMPAIVFNDSDSDVECVAPVSIPHFHWKCLLDDPNLGEPLVVDALIDNSSSLVLINEQLIGQLGLQVGALPSAVSISVALSEGHKQQFSLSQFVNLCVHSTNGFFQACTIHALILSGLCTPLLLRLPFLQHNKIVIDHGSRTCVAKDAMYDLLNSPLTNVEHTKTKTTRAELQQQKKDIRAELMTALLKYHEQAEAVFVMSSPLDFIAAIKHHIEMLT